MDNLIDTVTFFRNTDPNVSLIVIGIMLTWTLAAGSFLLARSGMTAGFIRRFVDTALEGLT